MNYNNQPNNDPNNPSRENESTKKHRIKRALAITAITALTATGAGAMVKAGRTEAFAKWNAGSTLKVKARTPSKVIGHRLIDSNDIYAHTARSGTAVDPLLPELDIEQSVQTANGTEIRQDWVEVSDEAYKHVKDGDSIVVDQLDKDWSNDLLPRKSYHITELPGQNSSN